MNSKDKIAATDEIAASEIGEHPESQFASDPNLSAQHDPLHPEFDKQPTHGSEDTFDALARIVELEQALSDERERVMRALAESENTRRRAERDKLDSLKYATATLARDLLPVADNLSRALHPTTVLLASEEALATLREGVSLTARELHSVLERHHIKRIEPQVGERFDPESHQAMLEIADVDRPSGQVAETFQAGYRIHDRLLRPAMVSVTTGGTHASAIDTNA